MGTIEASKYIPLKTLLNIRANHYRSENGIRDYDKSSVDLRIIERSDALSDKTISQYEHQLNQWEAERAELLNLVKTLKTSGRKFLGDSLLSEITRKLEIEMVNYV